MTAQAVVATRILSLAEARFDDFAVLLEEPEHEEANRFRLAEDRRRFVIARGLLRSMLAERTGLAADAIRLQRDPFGKLVSADAGNLAFNVSHSGSLVAVAVGAVRAIGVDVEEMRADLDFLQLAGHIFTPMETSVLASAEKPRRPEIFFRSWVCKEALVKGLGTGLSRDPKRFEVLFDGGAPEIRTASPAGKDIEFGWSLELLKVPAGYAGALAVLP